MKSSHIHPLQSRLFLLDSSLLLLLLIGCDSVQVDAPELRPPLLQAPRDAQIVSVGAAITFSWQAVDGARRYECEVRYADDEGQGVMNEDTDRTSATLTFDAPGNYSWRVRAKNDADEAGSWSEAWEIIVQVQGDPW